MSDAFQLNGEIIEIMDEKIISEKFKKREFVLKHAPNPDYPDFLKIEVVQNKTDLLDKYKVGDSVDVDINLKGKKWQKGNESGYFNSIQAWRIVASDSAKSADPEPW
jgi:hypothetical protein|tara:strand:+ start:150 stop:470 length:321 start_codon:yes stop_codon:yes gene_type:complete